MPFSNHIHAKYKSFVIRNKFHDVCNNFCMWFKNFAGEENVFADLLQKSAHKIPVLLSFVIYCEVTGHNARRM